MSAAETTDRSEALLGVLSSVTGKRWELRQADDRTALAIAQQHNVPDSVARIMAARGVDIEAAHAFLNPSLRDQMPDPSHLLDMDKAVTRVQQALAAGEKIALFGDYDVDGATSSAILALYLRALGVAPRLYIPDRMAEGYGPNSPAFEKLAAEGITLIITLDCGTTAHAPIARAVELGVDVLVLDHHAAEPQLPPALALVNPNRVDETSPHRQLAACGVAFLFVVALNRALRQAGFFTTRAEPDLMQLLDLVALGTVADVVPLTGLNRVFVAQGLKVLAQRRNIGLAALADISGLKERPEAWHMGYLLGPRVNAGGRIGAPDLGVKLLTAELRGEADVLAAKLNLLNGERRAIEAEVLEQALHMAETQANQPLIIVGHAGWHPGVIGIVAGRLKERFGKVAIVVAFENGVGKGSGRSVKGVDLGAAIIAARQAGLLVSGGGHEMAAGLTVSEAQFPALQAFLSDRVEHAMASLGGAPRLSCDVLLSVGGLTTDFITTLEQLGPYGSGNSEPRVALSHVRVTYADVVGGDHVRCQLVGSEGVKLKAIAFRCATQPLGLALLNGRDRLFHAVGSAKIDTFSGRPVPQFQIEDLAAV